MLRHRLKTGDRASRSERNAALIRTLSEAFGYRHKEYTNLRILAANEDIIGYKKLWRAAPSRFMQQHGCLKATLYATLCKFVRRCYSDINVEIFYGTKIFLFSFFIATDLVVLWITYENERTQCRRTNLGTSIVCCWNRPFSVRDARL